MLSAFDRIPVCTRYRLPDGSETREFPAHQSDFHHAEPVYEVVDGWRSELGDVGAAAELPDAARRYVDFVERELEVPVTWIGTGREREQALAR